MGIRSFDLSIFNLSLFSIFKKYCPWSNRSFNHKNERFIFLFFVCFWQFFPFPVDLCSLIVLKDRWDRFALVDVWKDQTGANRSCWSLKKERPWANRSFDLSITRNERFDRKTDDRIPIPAKTRHDKGKFFLASLTWPEHWSLYLFLYKKRPSLLNNMKWKSLPACRKRLTLHWDSKLILTILTQYLISTAFKRFQTSSES